MTHSGTGFTTSVLFAVLFLGAPWLRAQEGAAAKPVKKAAAPKHACDGDVWCGLFLAQSKAKADDEKADDEEESPIVAQLRKAFSDHSSFELIGENSASIFKEYECWIVPSEQLFLKIDSLGTETEENKNAVHVHLQLWQDDHVLLKSDTILRRTPVFITGPKTGEGQFIMVLKLACDEPETK